MPDFERIAARMHRIRTGFACKSTGNPQLARWFLTFGAGMQAGSGFEICKTVEKLNFPFLSPNVGKCVILCLEMGTRHLSAIND